MKLPRPAWPYLATLRTIDERLSGLYARLGELRGAVVGIVGRERDPFVMVLIEGLTETIEPELDTRRLLDPNGAVRWRPTTCGASGHVPERGTVFNIGGNSPMRSVRVTVFADFELVSVGGIYVGTDYVHAAIGECPAAYFERWPVGVSLRIPCERRR